MILLVNYVLVVIDDDDDDDDGDDVCTRERKRLEGRNGGMTTIRREGEMSVGAESEMCEMRLRQKAGGG